MLSRPESPCARLASVSATSPTAIKSVWPLITRQRSASMGGGLQGASKLGDSPGLGTLLPCTPRVFLFASSHASQDDATKSATSKNIPTIKKILRGFIPLEIGRTFMSV